MKWLVVTEQYICYMRDTNTAEIVDVMIIDSGFKVTKEKKNGILIENAHRKLLIRVT
jgi:hypothetical protein